MSGRVLAATGTAVGITAVLMFLGAGVLALDASESAADAFFRAGPASVVGILGVPLLVWVVLVVGADLLNRHRSGIVRLITDVVLTLLVGAVALVFWAVFSSVAGVFAALVVVIAATDVALFCAAALIALALTDLVLFRSTAWAVAD